jgi:hypothetical protein
MKSLANGLIAFVISLLIGLIAAWFFFREVPASDAVYKRVEPREAATPEVEKNVVFKPEFTRLPNYEELDFPELPDNFIDLYNTDGLLRRSEVLAKTGEKWLVMSEAIGGYRITPSLAKVKQLKSVSYPETKMTHNCPFPKQIRQSSLSEVFPTSSRAR